MTTRIGEHIKLFSSFRMQSTCSEIPSARASAPEHQCTNADTYSQWFYDKDTIWLRDKRDTLPDGSPAEQCLDKVTGRWIEPW